jgi:beta-glucosidase
VCSFADSYHRFGLSYTSFSFSDLSVTSHSGADADSFKVEVSVIVTNTGKTAGSEAVQLYISPPESNITHVPLQLKAFAKVRNLAPGNSEKVKLVLDKYAVSYWHEPARRWLAAVGQYGVYVGGSSADLPLKGEFKVTKSFAWSGL